MRGQGPDVPQQEKLCLFLTPGSFTPWQVNLLSYLLFLSTEREHPTDQASTGKNKVHRARHPRGRQCWGEHPRHTTLPSKAARAVGSVFRNPTHHRALFKRNQQRVFVLVRRCVRMHKCSWVSTGTRALSKASAEVLNLVRDRVCCDLSVYVPG